MKGQLDDWMNWLNGQVDDCLKALAVPGEVDDYLEVLAVPGDRSMLVPVARAALLLVR